MQSEVAMIGGALVMAGCTHIDLHVEVAQHDGVCHGVICDCSNVAQV